MIKKINRGLVNYLLLIKVLCKMLIGDMNSPGKRKSALKLFLCGHLSMLFGKFKDRWQQAWKLSFYYTDWMLANEDYDPDTVLREIETFAYKPLISIIMPVYKVELKFLRQAVESVLDNYYDNWELCICDDASNMKELKDYLKAMAHDDPRIKVAFREINGHISVSSNEALALASGEFVGFLDHDDILAPFAMYEVVKELNNNRGLDFIYSDEDLISPRGTRTWPVFKPDFAPHTFLSGNYLCHFSVIRKSLVDEVGGFRPGFEGSQDYDLCLRCLEKTGNIFHIRKILYHWRVLAQSTASGHGAKPYAFLNGLKALREHLERSGRDAVACPVDEVSHYRCIFSSRTDDLVSIIIPGRNNPRLLGECLESVYSYQYEAKFEIIYVDNGSDDPEVEILTKEYEARYDNFKVLSLPIDFNYSVLNNRAVEVARGNLLLFLNNDCQVITPEWLDYMAGYACQPEVGAVGAKLLYPNGRIQHAGICFPPGTTGRHMLSGCHKMHGGFFGNMYYQFNISAVTGACLMVERRKFEEAGGFDEQLGVCLNDIDLCLALRKAGYHNTMLPFVQLYHYEAKSRGYRDTDDKKQRFAAEESHFKQRWGVVVEDYYPFAG